MKSSTEQVMEFHKLFEHPIGNGPDHVEPLKIRQLRIKLLFEELGELAEAGDVSGTFESLCQKFISDSVADNGQPNVDGDNVDKVEELDAISDIQYVLDGKKLTSGLWPITDKAFELVHASNMCKAHLNHEHTEETIKRLGGGEGFITSEREGGLVLLNADGKVTKPWNHKKVDLSVLFKTSDVV